MSSEKACNAISHRLFVWMGLVVILEQIAVVAIL